MDFIDRHDEIRRLDDAMSRPRGFGVLWGRRRVGKTRLLTQWCQHHDCVYAVADQSGPVLQRRYLASALALRLPGFDEVEYPDWRALLRRLDRDAGSHGWRGPLIVDELPYLVAAEPEILAVLQNWLDSPSRQVGLVVCGSSMRMMHSAVLDSGAPLYGRASEAFPVYPLRPGFLADVFPCASARELVSAYAVWGGMPRYLELAEPFGAASSEAVDSLVLDPRGPLHREPDRLLQAETPSAIALRPLLDAIGNGAHRVSEIAGRLGRQASSLSGPLATLGEMGLIRRETPFGSDPKSGKRSLYQIADPFLRFWFRVVAPNRSLLAAAPQRDAARDLATPSDATRSLRLGRAVPHGRAESAPSGSRDCGARTPWRGATLLAGQRSGTGRRGTLGRWRGHPRRRSEVECDGRTTRCAAPRPARRRRGYTDLVGPVHAGLVARPRRCHRRADGASGTPVTSAALSTGIPIQMLPHRRDGFGGTEPGCGREQQCPGSRGHFGLQ